MNNKRSHAETPKSDRRPLKQIKTNALNSSRGGVPTNTTAKPNMLNSPRAIASGVVKDDKPVVNCSLENVTPVAASEKAKINKLIVILGKLKAQSLAHEDFIKKCEKAKINKLIVILDKLKAQSLAHKDFIKKCGEQIDDSQAEIKGYENLAKQFNEERNEPIKVKNLEPCVPFIAKDLVDNFIKQKLKIEEPNTELEEELIILTQRHEKLMAANNCMANEISKLMEDIDNEIELCDKRLGILEKF
uniref:Uncharacterized protein n=1 Tax=Panagrolaimus sp. PS1159 TaxID=55785 RepID=A0AC35EX33_9BILA